MEVVHVRSLPWSASNGMQFSQGKRTNLGSLKLEKHDKKPLLVKERNVQLYTTQSHTATKSTIKPLNKITDPGHLRLPSGPVLRRLLRPARSAGFHALPLVPPPARGVLAAARLPHRRHGLRVLHRPHLLREIRQDLLLLPAQDHQVRFGQDQ